MFNYYLDAFRVNYTNFTGRARRMEYWSFTLFSTIVSWVIQGFSVFALDMPTSVNPTNAFDVFSSTPFMIGGLYSLVALIPSLAILARRLHDVGKSGWFFLIVLIPLVGIIWLLVLLFSDSQPGENKWGPNPKGIGNTGNSDQLIQSIGQ